MVDERRDIYNLDLAGKDYLHLAMKLSSEMKKREYMLSEEEQNDFMNRITCLLTIDDSHDDSIMIQRFKKLHDEENLIDIIEMAYSEEMSLREIRDKVYRQTVKMYESKGYNDIEEVLVNSGLDR